jgi:DNA/RNA-binding domain of Phe-tRNA-synthetase-like protein
MTEPTPHVTIELAGWTLLWAELEPHPIDECVLAKMREDAGASARAAFSTEPLAAHPTVAAVRLLFRRAGCDPTRYRPASEALLRRLLKGEAMPAVHPLVDLGNCVSAALAVPVCVMDADRAAPPFTFRAGRSGEEMLSLKGPFRCEDKPLLLDSVGPADVPITGADRVRVSEHTRRASLIAYLPTATVPAVLAEDALRRVLAAAPLATLRSVAALG